MNNKAIGIIILVLGIGGSLAWFFLAGPGASGDAAGLLAPRGQVSLNGSIGSEKAGFLDDSAVAGLLAKRFGYTVSYRKVGSIEQVQPAALAGNDFLWPSSQVALDLFREKNPDTKARSEIIFNTPIVLYTWDKVSEALEKAGIVKLDGGVRYVEDMPKLIGLVLADTKWQAIGLGQIYGKVNIIPTDPVYSNSGFLFAGLMANLLAGDVVTDASLDAVLPKVQAYFRRQGFMERSTGNLFEQFLSKGMGSYPIIVGYENQLVEYGLQNPEVWARMKDRLRILYPTPTVWSSHTLIALGKDSGGLVDALRDKDLQRLAWERHGFRPAVAGVEADPKVFAVGGVPADISSVMPLSAPGVMEKLVAGLGTGSQ
jgi:hypothetical protein